MIDSRHWFTEQVKEQGVAFSLKIVTTLHEEQTEYQHIAIYQTEHFGNLMVIDGCIMLSDRDNFIYHEMLSHPVLFSHPDPKRVWIIGGGDCGTLREVTKHPTIESIHSKDRENHRHLPYQDPSATQSHTNHDQTHPKPLH